MSYHNPRFDHSRPLTEDEIRAVAPSVFGRTAHESRSDRFRAIPTIDAVRALKKEGFEVVSAVASGVRDPSHRDFGKHLLRFRRFDDMRAYQVGDNILETILKNANNGTASYDLFAGLFRIRCLNGMVAALGTIGTVKVRHTGDVIPKVIEGTYSVIESAKIALRAPEQWGQIQLDRAEQMAFAESAHQLRFTNEDENGNLIPVAEHAIKPAALLVPRRQDDTASDLWTTFNVVQENAIKGGLHGMNRDANNRLRRVTTRAVKGIDQDVKLNRALWTLADKMAQLKGGAKLAA